MIITGYKSNGEQIPFEKWVYDRWIYGLLNDEWLTSQLQQCIRFIREY